MSPKKKGRSSRGGLFSSSLSYQLLVQSVDRLSEYLALYAKYDTCSSVTHAHEAETDLRTRLFAEAAALGAESHEQVADVDQSRSYVVPNQAD